MNSHSSSIDNTQSLKEASDCLRDAEFADDDIRFDTENSKVIVSLWKPDKRLSLVYPFWSFVWKRTLPMRRIDLIFESVTDVHYTRDSATGKGMHELGHIRLGQARTVCLDTYDGLVVTIRLLSLQGRVQVTDCVDWKRAKRVFFFSMCRRA